MTGADLIFHQFSRSKVERGDFHQDFIAGEDFSIFNDTALALLEEARALRGDPDLGATNEGVSIIWLK